MQKLHHRGMGPPLTGNNAGSPLSNPPQTAGPTPFNAGSMNLAMAIKPVGGMMPSPPSPGINEGQQNGSDPGLTDLQQPGMGGLGDLVWDIDDFDQIFFRQDPGDLNFERDFGQWFNPGGDVTLDMK